MPNLPIVERELRVASRRPLTYWSRTGFALLAVALMLWTLSLRDLGMSGRMAGRQTFAMLAFVALFSAVVTALRLTAPAIASEKREGTLGLLFLTDLKPRDVVLGKLAVTSLGTFYRFLAIVPALGLPILMGGVTAGDLGRLALVLLNLMFLASTIGLFASTLSVDERHASGLAFLLMILVATGGPLAALIAWWAGLPDNAMLAMLPLSPIFACFSIVNAPWSMGGFWFSLITGHALAWVFLLCTCRLLPRVWQDRPASAAKAQRTERTRDMLQGDAPSRRERRTHLLNINPVLWLTSRDRAVRFYPWIFLGGVSALALWLTWKFNVPWTERSLALGAIWMVNSIFKTWVGSQSAVVLSADRDRGALELLLSTPLTIRDLVQGHWLALRRLFASPLLFLLACEALWVLFVLASGRDETDRSLAFWFTAYSTVFAVSIADLLALGWLGLWMGARAKNANDASGRTQWRVLILPWLATMGCMTLTNLLLRIHDSLMWWLGYWAFWSLLFDVFWTRHAQQRLEHSLREAAIERQTAAGEAAPGWIKAMARWLARLFAGNAPATPPRANRGL